MEADDAGNAIVTGQFESIDLGTPFVGSTLNQVFVAKLDSANQPSFALEVGELGTEDHVFGLGVGSNTQIAIVGAGGRIDFGGGALPQPFGGFGAVLTASGIMFFSEQYGVLDAVIPADAAIDREGYLIVVGDLNAPTDFGYGQLVPSGVSDIFVLKRPLPR